MPSFSHDGQDRLVTQTDPPVTDPVSKVTHTMVTSYAYDADSDVLTRKISCWRVAAWPDRGSTGLDRRR